MRRARDGDVAGFERFAQHLDDAAVELRHYMTFSVCIAHWKNTSRMIARLPAAARTIFSDSNDTLSIYQFSQVSARFGRKYQKARIVLRHAELGQMPEGMAQDFLSERIVSIHHVHRDKRNE
ncbi:hypothetical protein GCM10027321_36550 [Massilia terrae]